MSQIVWISDRVNSLLEDAIFVRNTASRKTLVVRNISSQHPRVVMNQVPVQKAWLFELLKK
jgi:hypothetical protein